MTAASKASLNMMSRAATENQSDDAMVNGSSLCCYWDPKATVSACTEWVDGGEWGLDGGMWGLTLAAVMGRMQCY